MDTTLLFGISYVCILLIQQTDQCILTNNGQSLPTFQDYYGQGAARINRYYQAIIPSYRLQCCGEITAWGVDVEPGLLRDDQREYTLNLQVWRPSPTVDQAGSGDYSLVGNNRFPAISLGGGVAEVTPSPQDRIQFQSGDVLGFYVEEARDNERGVVVLTTDSHTRELVWYASTSQTVAGCPISVGSGGDLNTILQGAPVISIATGTSDCPQILPTPPPCPITPPLSTAMVTEGSTTTAEPHTDEPTTSIRTPEPNNESTSSEQIMSLPTDEPLSLPGDDLTYNEPNTDESTIPVESQSGASQPLVIGTVAAILAVGILLSLTIIISVIICKKRSKSFNATQTSLQLGVTNRLQGIVDTSNTIEAETEQDEATHTDESMYSYPVVAMDPDQSIEARRNDAYAVNIVTTKNEAYNPVSTTSVRESTCTEEYDYI